MSSKRYSIAWPVFRLYIYKTCETYLKRVKTRSKELMRVEKQEFV